MCLIRRWLAELTLPDIFLAKVQGISIDRYISNLSNIPYQTYLATGAVTVEIPSLGIKIPVVGLNRMKYGDKIIIHAYGQKYTFAVQTNAVVDSGNSNVMRHEDKPWLTLMTCKDYDEKTGTYRNRVVVRAALVSVDSE